MAQVMGNFFGGNTSLGIDRFDRLGDQGDNGVYVIDGWKIVARMRGEYDEDYSFISWQDFPEEREQRVHDFDGMLRNFDEAMPEKLRLGEFLDSVEVPASELQTGDEVWMRVVGEKWEAFPVVGFGQPDSNRIAVWAETPDGKKEPTYPDLPYVAMCGHDGDFSWNCNNYVRGELARIKPRPEQSGIWE